MSKIEGVEKDLKLLTKIIDKLGLHNIITIMLVLGILYIVIKPIYLRFLDNDKKHSVILETIVEHQEHAVTKEYLNKVTNNLESNLSIEITQSEKRSTQNLINYQRTKDKAAELERLKDLILLMDDKIERIDMLRKDPKQTPLLNNTKILEDSSLTMYIKQKQKHYYYE